MPDSSGQVFSEMAVGLTDMEASKTKGTSSSVGTAMHIGLRPTSAEEPKVGTTSRPPIVMEIPMQSCSSALAACAEQAP